MTSTAPLGVAVPDTRALRHGLTHRLPDRGGTMHRRHTIAALTAAALTIAVLLAVPATPSIAVPAPTRALTNLAHLDFLADSVAPPPQPGHTTYRLDHDPAVGVLWVYANHLPEGGYQRTGGGSYDPAHNTYGQGSYDTDDIARAAVVYLRQWVRTSDQHSRDEAYQLLRGLTYLQTASGPNAGNVVLWMQPDGTLNPSPTPKDNPDPSDSDASYWLARTIWALGEGYADFRATDPGSPRSSPSDSTWRSAPSTGRCSPATAATATSTGCACRPG